MSYICPACGKHYASKADLYTCMSKDYKKRADEAKEETNIDLKLHLYAGGGGGAKGADCSL